jgi:hypothetical protein
MQLISSRTISYIDSQTLDVGEAQEMLFRNDCSFVLYLSAGDMTPSGKERVISLELREALIWLNENPQDWGAFWN